MKQKVIAAATLFLAGIGAGSWWMVQRQRAHERYVFEHSEPQQLMQACRKAAWDKLEPSTAVLVDFRVEQPGGKSVIAGELQAKVDQARMQFEMAKSAEAKQKALQDERAAKANREFDAMARKGEILPEDAKLRQTELSLFDVEMLIRAKTATNAAMEEYVDAENARRAHEDRGYGEVFMTVDAQERASATRRMDVVCTWLKKPTSEESASTVKLAKLGERGS
jgi:hypothetical protein